MWVSNRELKKYTRILHFVGFYSRFIGVMAFQILSGVFFFFGFLNRSKSFSTLSYENILTLRVALNKLIKGAF